MLLALIEKYKNFANLDDRSNHDIRECQSNNSNKVKRQLDATR